MAESSIATMTTSLPSLGLTQSVVFERLKQLKAWQQKQQETLLRKQQEQLLKLQNEQLVHSVLPQTIISENTQAQSNHEMVWIAKLDLCYLNNIVMVVHRDTH